MMKGRGLLLNQNQKANLKKFRKKISSINI